MRINLSESIMSSIKESDDKKFRYSMLGRLKSDCDYFLGNGNRNERHLWAHSIDEQIAKMKELHNSFADDEKPEWLTMDQIDEYERKMKSDEDNGEEYHIENPTVVEDKDDLNEAEELNNKLYIDLDEVIEYAISYIAEKTGATTDIQKEADGQFMVLLQGNEENYKKYMEIHNEVINLLNN